MDRESVDTVVIGAGSGAAIGWRLALDGRQVLILSRRAASAGADGSTERNHRIKHSGAMQEGLGSARRLWEAFRSMDPIERAHLRSQGGVFHVPYGDADAVVRRWSAAEIPFRRLAADHESGVSVEGAEAFATPDGVIDYPGVVRDLLVRAVANGARVEAVRRTRLVGDAGGTRGGRVGVLVETAGSRRLVQARTCVVAAGAWAPELLADAGISVPVERWKTHVLAVGGEHVPEMTVSLGPPLLVMVPFDGSTLVGDARRVRAHSGDDVAADPALAEALRDDAGRVFPHLRAADLATGEVTAGIKTETVGHGSRSQDLAVFDASTHGVDGVTVAFPGKASLMFALADRTLEALRAQADVVR